MGKFEPTSTPEGHALAVTLNKNEWSLLSQDLRLPYGKYELTIQVVVAAQPDFKPEEKSSKYADVDFGMGGEYGWSAKILSKADCLIRVENATGWDYRPVKLKPGTTQTITKKMKFTQAHQVQELLLAFPPGTGSVIVKSVSIQIPDTKK